jgi:hypothetical protein
MPGEVFSLYEKLIRDLAGEMNSLGFASSGPEEFVRVLAKVHQRLRVSLRFDPHAGIGYVEVFPGFNFHEVESLAARLQGKKVRSGFITCSLNIGLLGPQGASTEWPLSSQSSLPELLKEVSGAIHTLGAPFWEEFSTMEMLLARFEAADTRVRRGDWLWRYAATNCLLGNKEKALDFLKQQCQVRPQLKRSIENAIEVISS